MIYLIEGILNTLAMWMPMAIVAVLPAAIFVLWKNGHGNYTFKIWHLWIPAATCAALAVLALVIVLAWEALGPYDAGAVAMVVGMYGVVVIAAGLVLAALAFVGTVIYILIGWRKRGYLL